VALTVAAGLAQVGEFTFILATAGLQLDLLPTEGFQLLVAAAIISIALNPAAFAIADRLEPRTRELRIARWFRNRGAGGLITLPAPIERRSGRRHAVVAGFGRVGSIVAGALDRRGFGYVVIELDRRRVEQLREDGIAALYGDASNPELLIQADIEHAAVLVLAMEDPTSAAVAFERARALNPRLEVVMRTHAEQTAARLRDQERVWPIVGERELGVQMARVTLRRFGISGPEVEAIAQGLRVGPPRGPGRDGGRGGPGQPGWLARRLASLRLRRLGRRDGAAPVERPAADKVESLEPIERTL
jgi:CPA2 family monovalent cation:H+ antiporter-2